MTMQTEKYPPHLPPSERITPKELPQPPGAAVAHVETLPAEPSTIHHPVDGEGQAPQQRLDALRKIEGDLLTERPALERAQRDTRGAVQEALRALQEVDPHRVSPAENAAQYRESCLAERAERVARQGGQPRIAYVDLERRYGRGTDGNAFARSQARTLNRRGAYAHAGGVNRDPSRGATPETAAAARPTIPLLAK
jgi:hypothetical protein